MASNMTNVSYCLTNLRAVNDYRIWICIGIFTVLCNLVLFISMATSKSIRNPSNVIISSSFFIGILFGGIYILPRWGTPYYHRLNVFCAFLPILGSSFLLNYNLHQCLISIDRLIAIRWPIMYRHSIKPKHYIIAVMCLWIFSLLISSVPIMTFRIIPMNGCNPISYTTQEIKFHLILFFGLFYVPIILIVGCYSYIFYKIFWKNPKSKLINVNDASIQISINTRKAISASKQMFYLTLLFLFTLFPYFCSYQVNILTIGLSNGLLDRFYKLPCWVRLTLPLVTRYIAFLYPAINPLMYAYFVKGIRTAVHDYFLSKDKESPKLQRYR